MIIDCATCSVRGVGCADCVVSVLLGAPDLDEQERAAVSVLAQAGLLPPLRLVAAAPPPDEPTDYRAREVG